MLRKFMLLLIVFFASTRVVAQTIWPSEAGPGLGIWEWKLSPNSLQWLRIHRPKEILELVHFNCPGCHDGKTRYDIAYAGDTVTIFKDTGSGFGDITKFDGANVMRYYESRLSDLHPAQIQVFDQKNRLIATKDESWISDSLHQIQIFDQDGRLIAAKGISVMDGREDAAAWSCSDDGKCLHCTDSNSTRLEYYSRSRTDSVFFITNKLQPDTEKIIRHIYNDQNQLIVTKSFNHNYNHSNQIIDSFSYYPSGIMRYDREWITNCDSNGTTCLYDETAFDEHGNVISVGLPDSANRSDTYEYDGRGRPIKRTEHDGFFDTYEWAEDNRILNGSSHNSNGVIGNTARFEYHY